MKHEKRPLFTSTWEFRCDSTRLTSISCKYSIIRYFKSKSVNLKQSSCLILMNSLTKLILECSLCTIIINWYSWISCINLNRLNTMWRSKNWLISPVLYFFLYSICSFCVFDIPSFYSLDMIKLFLTFLKTCSQNIIDIYAQFHFSIILYNTLACIQYSALSLLMSNLCILVNLE